MVNLINFAYLVASVLFILGLKGLTHPRTAVRGNMLGALGMLLAIGVTLFSLLSVESVDALTFPGGQRVIFANNPVLPL